MSNPKRQHSVSKFLLKRFTDSEGLLHLYDKNNPNLGVKRISPSNAFLENHLYTRRNESGKPDFQIEKMFADLEAKAAPIITGMVKSAFNGEPPNLTDTERILLQKFLIFLRRRSPDRRDFINNFAESKIREVPTKYEEYIGRPLNQEELAISSDPNFLRHQKENSFPNFAGTKPSQKRMNFLSDSLIVIGVISRQNESFVIGSSPLESFHEWVPIDKNVAVKFAPTHTRDNLFQFLDHSEIRKINERTVRQSDKFAGHSAQLTESLVPKYLRSKAVGVITSKSESS